MFCGAAAQVFTAAPSSTTMESFIYRLLITLSEFF